MLHLKLRHPDLRSLIMKKTMPMPLIFFYDCYIVILKTVARGTIKIRNNKKKSSLFSNKGNILKK